MPVRAQHDGELLEQGNTNRDVQGYDGGTMTDPTPVLADLLRRTAGHHRSEARELTPNAAWHDLAETSLNFMAAYLEAHKDFAQEMVSAMQGSNDFLQRVLDAAGAPPSPSLLFRVQGVAQILREAKRDALDQGITFDSLNESFEGLQRKSWVLSDALERIATAVGLDPDDTSADTIAATVEAGAWRHYESDPTVLDEADHRRHAHAVAKYLATVLEPAENRSTGTPDPED